MKRSIARWLIIFAVVVGFAVACHVSFDQVTGRKLAVHLARVQKPGAMDAYEKLFYELTRDDSRKPASEAVFQSTQFDGFPDDAADIIAGYDRLFDHLAAKEDSARQQIWSDAGRSEVVAFLLTNQDLVREIRQMADRGGPVYPIDFSKRPTTQLPHLTNLRSCAWLLRADAVVKAGNGNKSEAVENIIAGMKLGDALVPEPVLVSQFARISIYWLMYDALQRSLHGRDISEELTRRLMRQVAGADHRRAFAESLAGEQQVGIQVFSDVRAGERVVWDMDGLTEASPPPVMRGIRNARMRRLDNIAESAFLNLYYGSFGGPWMNLDEATFVESVTRLVGAAGKPSYEIVPELNQLELESNDLPPTKIFSRRILPVLLRRFEAQARHEAVLDLMQMGILLEQYRARNGSFPDSLEAIAPELGGSLPVDPFIGSIYHYRLSGDSFVLYSYGRNLVDDGGRHSLWNGDIVWRGEEE